MLLEQTRDYISKLGDEELIEYVLEGIYEPEAIAFAKQEIERRNLDPQRAHELAAVAQEHVEARRAEEVARDNRPLGWVGRTLAFLGGFCCLIWPLVITWFILDDGSNTQRRNDVVEWAGIGFCTALIIGMIYAIFFARV
jgi:hypothetical protein